MISRGIRLVFREEAGAMYISKLAEHLARIRELKRAKEDGSTTRKDQVKVSLEHLKACDPRSQKITLNSDN